jgi:hypothetical protein
MIPRTPGRNCPGTAGVDGKGRFNSHQIENCLKLLLNIMLLLMTSSGKDKDEKYLRA